MEKGSWLAMLGVLWFIAAILYALLHPTPVHSQALSPLAHALIAWK